MSHQNTIQSNVQSLEMAQIECQEELYATDMNESKAYSVLSRESNVQKLITFFQTYECKCTSFDMTLLHRHQHLKLKKYKEATYYGIFIHGKRNGLGIMIYDNSRLYEGNWKEDFKHGYGYEIFLNNCIYEGEYSQGLPEGVGKYSWSNGEFYDGEWQKGLKHGSGMWKGYRGDSYIGEWKEGKAHGYGVHTWINGDRYEGEFKECLKSGQGIEKFANGDLYKGEYLNGKPDGYGEYYWTNGSYFKGSFKNGLRSGQGIWKKSPGNSDRYEGNYECDKKSSFGTFTWTSGNVYKGNYEGEIRNGYGEMFWSDGTYYKGQWKNGLQHGEGEIYVPGEGTKKGTFEENILISIENSTKAEEKVNILKSTKDLTSSELILNHHPEKQSLYMGTKKNNRKSGAKFQIKNKTTIEKKKIIHSKSIDENKILRYGETEKGSKSKIPFPQNHPLLPKKFHKREQKYVTLERKTPKPETPRKERVLHSSFYMHQMHKRGKSVHENYTDLSINEESSQDHLGKETYKEEKYFKREREKTFVFKTPYI